MTAAATPIPTISPVPGSTLLADLNVNFGGWRLLTADDTGGTNVNTAQPWFPTGSATGVSLLANVEYEFVGRLYATRAAGNTSHTTDLLFGGTCTINSIEYWGDARTGDTNTIAARNGLRATATSLASSNVTVKAASTSTTEDLDCYCHGIVRVNAAGTFIPQFKYSAAPGGTPTIKRGTFFRIWPLNPVSPVNTDEKTASPYAWS